VVYAYDKSVQHDAVLSKSAEDKDERQYLYERASQYGDENIKIVRLQKTADPLVRFSAVHNSLHFLYILGHIHQMVCLRLTLC